MPFDQIPTPDPVRSDDMSVLEFDVVVVGGGIAGLAFTLRLPRNLRIALLTKGALGESNTRYAQGGLAAAIGPQDDPALHFADTIASGAGLCDEDNVRALVGGGPDAVAWLLSQGANFDLEAGQIALGLEAAHSRNRVLHAGGDATGAEIERSLVQQIHELPRITLFEHATAIDLIRASGPSAAVTGVNVLLAGQTTPTQFRSRLTVLANGGAGQIWAVSSNPPGATGDGIAMALRAGVAVADLEFTQFHPTVFSSPGAEPFLMTEAIRGEGGYLRDAAGQRFMLGQHPLAELAPRDVVARSVQSRMQQDENSAVWLDLRHLDAELVRRRFPTILQHLAQYNLDLTNDLIPVAPAAHYFIGGIVADSTGATSVAGLLAIGEVSCTGVHGANRLASNSLLEGLVFGLRAADRVTTEGLPVFSPDSPLSPTHSGDTPAPTDQARMSTIQRSMSDDVAVVRNAESLAHATSVVGAMRTSPIGTATIGDIELRNAVMLATEIIESATFRRESRGAHFRSDFPHIEVALGGLHQLVMIENGKSQRRYDSLAAVIRSSPRSGNKTPSQ